MAPDMNMKELERKAWIAYFDDGILDMTAGLFILIFGIGMTTRYNNLAALSWMVIFFFGAAKKWITLQRVGLVKFSEERERRVKKEIVFFTVFFTITALIGLGFFLALASGIPISVKSIIGRLALASYLLIIAVSLWAVGYWKQINRFYAYGGLILLGVLAGLFVDISGVNQMTVTGYQFLIPGVVILLAGILLLVRFLKKYPNRGGGKNDAG